MTSHPQWIALTGLMFLSGCQTMDSLAFWRNSDEARFTAEELAAIDAQPIQPMSGADTPMLSGGPAPIQPRGGIVQASYGTDAGPPAAAQRVEQLVQSGQSVVAQSQSDPVALQTARSYFEQALALDGTHAGAHHGMAIVADLTHDYSTAELHYKQALMGQPNDANLLNDLGYSYILQHRFTDAANFLNRAAQVAPQNKQPKVNLALLALKKGDRAEAQRIISGIYPADQIAGTLAELEARVVATGVPRATVAGTSPTAGASPTTMTTDPGVAAQDVLMRVQQERERAESERLQMAASEQPVHVYPPGVAPPSTGSMAANPNLISLPDGQKFQVDTTSYGNTMQGHGLPGGAHSNPMSQGMAIHGNVTARMPSNAVAGNGYPVTGQMPVIQSVQDVHGQAMANLPVAQPYPQPPATSRVSLQSAPVAGLNAGPGALFPVASMQRVPSRQPANGMATPQPGLAMSQTGMAVPQPGMAAPQPAMAGSTPGPYYQAAVPPTAAPMMPGQANYSAQYPTGLTAAAPVNTFPQQRIPNAGQPAVHSGAVMPTGAADPLEAYELQLQQLDNQYDQAVRQMDARPMNVQPIPAQY